jgi:hypothetical protein
MQVELGDYIVELLSTHYSLYYMNTTAVAVGRRLSAVSCDNTLHVQ